MWKETEEFLLKDKYLGTLVKKFGSCKIRKGKKNEYFEDLVASIVEQQLSGKAAIAIFTRVKNLLKKNSKAPKSPILAEDVLKVKVEELRACGISWSKARYIIDLADKTTKRIVEIDKLEKLSDEEVIEELVKVKGIGRWTAEMFLMFTLARPNIFPVDDLGIQKGFEKVTGKKFDRVKSAKFAERHWKPYRTIACWYLWKSLE